MCSKFFLSLILGSCLTMAAMPAGAQQPSQCGPVVDQGTLFFTFECLNDGIFLKTDAAAASWKYAFDSDEDGVDGNTIGTKYEIFGMAWRELPEEIWIVLNSNMPLNGHAASGAAGGRVSHGDLFLDLKGTSFLEASNQNELFAIRYSDNNESGVNELGVYKNVKAKSVTSTNTGFATLAAYKKKISDLGGILGFGDLPTSQSYYADSISLNVIDEGDYVAPIFFLNLNDLEDAGFDLNAFAGSATIAFKFRKDSIIDTCGVVGGDNSSCLDCQGVPCGTSGEDQCGICDGDNSTCADCLGIPNGPNRYDQSGACCLPQDIDQCGQCYGDGTSCLDCEGTPWGTKKVDQCGVCDGDGTSCLDCLSVPNGQARFDICGVCDGDGTSCLDCEGIPGGNKKVDQCGVCDGDGTSCLDCEGTLGGNKKIDQCGICGGDGTSCLDCADVPFGSAKVDECGVCEGDGSSCAEVECVEQAATKVEQRRARKVNQSAKVLRDRTSMFAAEATRCDGRDRSDELRQARQAYQRVTKLLAEKVTNSVRVCETDICAQESQRQVKRQLRTQAQRLHQLAKGAKVNAINSCRKEHEPMPYAKVSEDYRDDLLTAIKRLPKAKLQCS